MNNWIKTIFEILGWTTFSVKLNYGNPAEQKVIDHTTYNSK